MSAVLQREEIARFCAYGNYVAIVSFDDLGQQVTDIYDYDGYPKDKPRHLFGYGLPISSDQELIELLAVYDAGETAGEKSNG